MCSRNFIPIVNSFAKVFISIKCQEIKRDFDATHMEQHFITKLYVCPVYPHDNQNLLTLATLKPDCFHNLFANAKSLATMRIFGGAKDSPMCERNSSKIKIGAK